MAEAKSRPYPQFLPQPDVGGRRGISWVKDTEVGGVRREAMGADWIFWTKDFFQTKRLNAEGDTLIYSMDQEAISLAYGRAFGNLQAAVFGLRRVVEDAALDGIASQEDLMITERWEGMGRKNLLLSLDLVSEQPQLYLVDVSLVGQIQRIKLELIPSAVGHIWGIPGFSWDGMLRDEGGEAKKLFVGTFRLGVFDDRVAVSYEYSERRFESYCVSRFLPDVNRFDEVIWSRNLTEGDLKLLEADMFIGK